MAIQFNQQKIDTSPTKVKAQRGFKTQINGEAGATHVMPGSVVVVPFNVACSLRASQKAYGVPPETPLKVVTVAEYKIPDRSRGNSEVAKLREQLVVLAAQVEKLQQRTPAAVNKGV